MKNLSTLMAACLLILAAGKSAAIPVTITTEAPILVVPGITTGTGTGDLTNGVLTFDLVYHIDMGEFAQVTLVSYGTIEDGEPPTAVSGATSCTGSALVCSPYELNVLSEIKFDSGGPLSETAVTVLTTPPSSSGNSGPTTWTITPIGLGIPREQPGPALNIPTMPVYALILTIAGLLFSARRHIHPTARKK